MNIFRNLASRSMAVLLFSTSVLPMFPQQPTDSVPASREANVRDTSVSPDEEAIEKILFIGDSMTGWLAERMNAYGRNNGFEVATVVWDGSTILKWASSSKLASLISEQNPDAVFICLGLNELFERKPETRFKSAVDKIVSAVGDRGFVWIGPPSWPGHAEGKILNDWIGETLGDKHFFRSYDLDLQRQSKSNPHPSRDGIVTWVSKIIDWLPDSSLEFRSLEEPEGPQWSRGNFFIYKRMNETL